jgi:hypothetical protein
MHLVLYSTIATFREYHTSYSYESVVSLTLCHSHPRNHHVLVNPFLK